MNRPIKKLDQDELYGLAGEVLGKNSVFKLTASGGSMFPFIREGDAVYLKKTDPRKIKIFDVIFFRREDGEPVIHRVIKIKPPEFTTRGDYNRHDDRPIKAEQIIGKVVAVGRGRMSFNLIYLFAARMILIFVPWIQKIQSFRVYRFVRRWFSAGFSVTAEKGETGYRIRASLKSKEIGRADLNGDYISDLWVDTLYRRIGAAEKMVEYACGIAGKNGAKKIAAAVAADNLPSKKLFEKLKFKPEGLDEAGNIRFSKICGDVVAR